MDDDFATEALVDYLSGKGYEAIRIGLDDALDEILDVLVKSDLVIVDVMMQRPDGISEHASHGGHRTGLVVAQRLRGMNPSLPIIAYSASQDAEVQRWFQETPNTYFMTKLTMTGMKDIAGHVEAILGGERPPLPRPFIVHGHDEAAKLALKNYLQNVLCLPEPIILHEQPSQGRVLLEKFEHYAGQAQLAFVLLTPDDRAASGSEASGEKRRARQNVILELGYFLAHLKRTSGRVLLLHKGPLELPSDIAGLIYIDISNGIEAAGEAIRRELRDVLA